MLAVIARHAHCRLIYGGGRKAHLTLHRDKLLFILFYFRHYPTQEVQGFLFGMSQAQTSEWIR
ncbi:MAG: transposase family protein, partial [Leptolyngbyaceae cyanobacterium]